MRLATHSTCLHVVESDNFIFYHICGKNVLCIQRGKPNSNLATDYLVLCHQLSWLPSTYTHKCWDSHLHKEHDKCPCKSLSMHHSQLPFTIKFHEIQKPVRMENYKKQIESAYGLFHITVTFFHSIQLIKIHQWFPKHAPQIPGDLQLVPRGSMVTFL